MQIIYKTGDALAGTERFFCHGCNAQGVMGSGIAAQVRAQFPAAYKAYREQYEREGLKLGDRISVDCGTKTIINAVTQEHYGRDPNTVYVSYEAIEKAVRGINAWSALAENSAPMKRMIGQPKEVAFPLIGAGLANGDWDIISKIIEGLSTDFQPVVYLFDGKMPQGRGGVR